MKRMLLQQYIDRQAERNPDAIALVHEQSSWTYGSLCASSNRLARLLKDSGCRKGDRVGILLPKSPEAIVGILGTLKADCIYVPMDVASPASRLQMVLDACEPACVIGAGSSQKVLGDLNIAAHTRLGWLDSQNPAPPGAAFQGADLDAVSAERLDYTNLEQDVAHILFTSGSTGRPKGVMITHRNVRHFVEWAVRYFGFAPSDRISGHPPLHFDLSTFDIYGTFCAGAQLHLVPAQLSLLPHKLAEFIRSSELTQWFSVPSLLNYMAKFDVVSFNDFPALKRLLWCGEKFPTPALIYWMKRLPHVTFTNLYGPTEATIASSYYRVPECPEDPNRDVPIGAACEGEELLVLDDDLKLTAPGTIGQLYIGGVGLSPGYWRDAEMTRKAFLPNPFPSAMDRIYKTGDLASVDEQGLVYLHGRADSQIKNRGYRIELGDIEAALHTLEHVRECAVVAIHTDGFEGTVICCAVVPAEGATLNAQTLRGTLAERLPSYMIPSRWMLQTTLPLNANGKIDRPKIKDSFHRAAEPIT